MLRNSLAVREIQFAFPPDEPLMASLSLNPKSLVAVCACVYIYIYKHSNNHPKPNSNRGLGFVLAAVAAGWLGDRTFELGQAL